MAGLEGLERAIHPLVTLNRIPHSIEADQTASQGKSDLTSMNNRRTREIKGKDLDRQFDKATRGLFTVKIRELFVGTLLPFGVLFPTLDKATNSIVLQMLIPEGGMYDSALRDWLSQEGIEDVYISKDKEDHFFEYLSENVKGYIHSPEVSPEKKTMLLYDSAESIVGKVFRERPTRENLNLGCDLIENIAVHLTLDTVASNALLHIFSKDYYTFTHSVQVAMLGMAFCNYLQWNKEEVIDYGIGALFHDVGKSRIGDEILNKPSRLTKEEFDVIKKHTVIGYQELKNTQTLSKSQLNIPLSHHESMDGTGYPQGLKGEQIGKHARVARIIDCYDALTTRRSYKEALSSSKALEIMGTEMGSTFDKRLLQAFISFLGAEKTMQESRQGKRLNLELGREVYVRSGIDDVELKLTVMGMEIDELLILRIPAGMDTHEYLRQGEEVTARFTHAGSMYQFSSTVLGHVSDPLPFVLLSYPQRVESLNMRKDPRCECLIRVRVGIRGAIFQGLLLNLSSGGCKVVLKLSEGDKLPEMRVEEKIRIQPQSAEGESAQSLTGVVKNLSITSGKALLGVQFHGVSDEDVSAMLQRAEKAFKRG